MTSQRYISPEINNSNEKHFREGKEEGLKEGLEKGILQVAKNMKAAGVDDAVILATTGLTKEEIDKLWRLQKQYYKTKTGHKKHK